jgi:Ssp1 endopeptidase immunity protein Rap1a
MLTRSLLIAAVAISMIMGAWAQSAPGNSNEIRLLTRCTDDFDRCQKSIVDAAKTAPDVTRDFVAFCADHVAACEDRIIVVDSHNAFSARRRCLIGRRGTAELPETVKTIVAWLAQHPETADRQTDDGVTAAVAALWPC